MRLIIATGNAGKLREIRAILGEKFDEILSMKEAGITHETVEDGSSFLENAQKKAREIAEIAGCAALADDSGICVDALGGAPGIYSARFCGRHGDDEANNRLLVEKLQGVEDRSAHYTCAISLAFPDGSEKHAEGYLHGTLADPAAGTINVYSVMNTLNPADWSDADFDTLCTMQERVNDLIGQLTEDPRFTK